MNRRCLRSDPISRHGIQEGIVSKITPGPWRIDERAANHVIADSRPICSVSYFTTGLPDHGAAENEANAKAIAKVPEMVEILKRIEPLSSKSAEMARAILKDIGELP